jgi:hypothetical protein
MVSHAIHGLGGLFTLTLEVVLDPLHILLGQIIYHICWRSYGGIHGSILVKFIAAAKAILLEDG